MSRLVRLYPPAWRERYLAEFADLLAERPPSLRDRIDIVRGAADAWLRPQVAGRAPRPDSGGRSVAALVAALAGVAGGLLFVASALSMTATPVRADLGYKVVDLGISLLLFGMVLTGIAGIALAPRAGSRTTAATVSAIAMVVGGLMVALPWPILFLGFVGYAVSAVAFGLVIGRIGSLPLGGAVSIAAAVLTAANTEDARALVMIPLGLAWCTLHAVAALRPATRPAAS